MNTVFGKSLPANQRVYFVLCDSVAKQLDGLKKQNPYVGHSIRKLMSSGLDQYGPAGVYGPWFSRDQHLLIHRIPRNSTAASFVS